MPLWYSDTVEADAIARVRWHAELGANGFDHLDPDHAAHNAQSSLKSICTILDDLDHANSLASIFRVTGIEPRFRREGAISDQNAG